MSFFSGLVLLFIGLGMTGHVEMSTGEMVFAAFMAVFVDAIVGAIIWELRKRQ